MTPLQQSKLTLYRSKLGPLSSTEAMQLALEADQFATDCGAHDPAFDFMVRQRETMLSYAELLELEENQVTKQQNYYKDVPS